MKAFKAAAIMAGKGVQLGSNMVPTGVIVPQKGIITPATYTELCNTLTDTASTGGTRSLNTNEYIPETTASVKLTGAVAGTIVFDKLMNVDFTTKSPEIWLYPHTSIANIGSITLSAYKVGSTTDYFTIIIKHAYLIQGQWNQILSSKFDAIGSGAPDWSNIGKIRVRITTPASLQNIISVNLGYSDGGTRTKLIMMNWDDVDPEVYTMCFPLMQARGMVGTIYQIGNTIDDPSRMTSAMLQEMYAAGWDIGNHSLTHVDLTTLATKAEIIAELDGCRSILDNLGLTRSSKHVAYPSGAASPLVVEAMTEWGALTGRGGGVPVRYNTYMNFPYRISWAGSDTMINLKKYMSSSINQNIHSMTWHKVTDVITAAQFEEYLDYIIELGFKTITMDEFYRLNSSSITINHN